MRSSVFNVSTCIVANFLIIWCVSFQRENEAGEVKEEGAKEMTLDEWKAMQEKEKAKVDFNIRKANEGADSQWKKGYVLHKSKTENVSRCNRKPQLFLVHKLI